MFLTVRPTVAGDFPGIFNFVKKRFHIPSADCADLQKMWGQILLEADHTCSVIEDSDQAEGQRIVSFFMTYCVPEALMDYARGEAPPFFWRWILQRWRRGERIWLDKRESRKAQMEGLVSVFTHVSADVYRFAGAELGQITNMHAAAATRDLVGQKVRYYVTEVYGQPMRERFQSHGFALLSDYGRFQDDPAFKNLPPEQRPCLMIADLHKAAENRRIENTSVGQAALAMPPRYGFSQGEQEVMKIALSGLTDQAIAGKLGLSLVAVKKRWKGIYAKVMAKPYPRPLDQAGGEEDESDQKIGRRQVLLLMAEHPEEFRPSPPKKRPAK